MRVYKVNHTFYRVSNNGKVKDVKIAFNKIQEPENPYNILTETEKQEVELELSKSKKNE